MGVASSTSVRSLLEAGPTVHRARCKPPPLCLCNVAVARLPALFWLCAHVSLCGCSRQLMEALPRSNHSCLDIESRQEVSSQLVVVPMSAAVSEPAGGVGCQYFASDVPGTDLILVVLSSQCDVSRPSPAPRSNPNPVSFNACNTTFPRGVEAGPAVPACPPFPPQVRCSMVWSEPGSQAPGPSPPPPPPTHPPPFHLLPAHPNVRALCAVVIVPPPPAEIKGAGFERDVLKSWVQRYGKQ
jgi:hypothetical protein